MNTPDDMDAVGEVLLEVSGKAQNENVGVAVLTAAGLISGNLWKATAQICQRLDDIKALLVDKD